MKLTALAVAILALGILAGFALAGGASERSVSAVPQCPGPSAHCATATPAPSLTPTLAPPTPTPAPPQDPLEFNHVLAQLCTTQPTGFCEPNNTGIVRDVNAELTALSAAGWQLNHVEAATSPSGLVRMTYTLSRIVP